MSILMNSGLRALGTASVAAFALSACGGSDPRVIRGRNPHTLLMGVSRRIIPSCTCPTGGQSANPCRHFHNRCRTVVGMNRRATFFASALIWLAEF